MAADDGSLVRRGREGSRWYNERPPASEVAEWYEKSVAPTLHDEMEADRYLSGIMLVVNKEKDKNAIAGYRDDGSPIIVERSEVVFSPYPKVETRIKYFWDLMALKAGEWIGVIEPIGPGTTSPMTLPPGFGYIPSEKNALVTCTMKVTVFDAASYEETVTNRGVVVRTGKKVIDPPPATKTASIKTSWGSLDEHFLAKAETGAVGRALGMAGMLVVPGSGVATHEDMIEAVAGQGVPQPEPEAKLPDQPTAEEMRERIAEMNKRLGAEAPDRQKQVAEWAKERKMGKVSDLSEAELRGLYKMLERTTAELDEAQKAGQGEPEQASD